MLGIGSGRSWLRRCYQDQFNLQFYYQFSTQYVYSTVQFGWTFHHRWAFTLGSGSRPFFRQIKGKVILNLGYNASKQRYYVTKRKPCLHVLNRSTRKSQASPSLPTANTCFKNVLDYFTKWMCHHDLQMSSISNPSSSFFL